MKKWIAKLLATAACLLLLCGAAGSWFIPSGYVYMDINPSIRLAVNGYTVYCMDSQTDDYTVEDENGYGEFLCDGVIPVAQEGYLQLQQATTFHRFSQQVVAVTLRPSAAGIYYKCVFFGDEPIREQVASYGVALGAGKLPNFEEGTYSCFTDLACWNQSEEYTSTLLKGILKETNTRERNAINREIKILGRPYIRMKNGALYQGETVEFSLRNVIEGTDTTMGVDGLWDTLTPEQQTQVLQLYKTYEPMLADWNIPNIKYTANSE